MTAEEFRDEKTRMIWTLLRNMREEGLFRNWTPGTLQYIRIDRNPMYGAGLRVSVGISESYPLSQLLMPIEGEDLNELEYMQVQISDDPKAQYSICPELVWHADKGLADLLYQTGKRGICYLHTLGSMEEWVEARPIDICRMKVRPFERCDMWSLLGKCLDIGLNTIMVTRTGVSEDGTPFVGTECGRLTAQDLMEMRIHRDSGSLCYIAKRIDPVEGAVV